MKSISKVSLVLLAVVVFSSRAFSFPVSGVFNDNETDPEEEVYVNEFVSEVVSNYRTERQSTDFMAEAIFEEYGMIEGAYAKYTISSGDAIYAGDKKGIANMALFTFVPEKINKSARTTKWMESYKKSHAPLMGSVGLNSFQYFETIGPLSKYANKYDFELDSQFKLGGELIYKISFKAKPEFKLKGRFVKGYMIVFESSKRIKSISYSGEVLWSSIYDQRVSGDIQYEFDYFNGFAYLKKVDTYYKKKNIEEKTSLRLNIKTLVPIDVNANDVFDIQILGSNSKIISDKSLTKNSTLGVDFDRLLYDLENKLSLLEQYEASNGKNFWHREREGDVARKEHAIELIKEF